MFRKLILFVLVFVLAALGSIAQGEQLPKQGKLPPITVLSIIPAQGEPGMTVTVNGTGFTPGTTPFLGTVQLTGNVIAGKTVTFDLPDLPAGVYAFYLKREDGSTSRAFNFTIQPLRPVASGLSPDNVAVCASGREREVLFTGSNFQPGARVLFDGAAVSTRFISSAALAFSVPQLPGGLHQVQVKNPSDAASGNLALVIDAKPEILNVSIGNDFVSYYELLISGRNFQQTSVLVVDGNRVATGRPAVGERDQLIFLGCNQLVYQRHPYDTTPKEIRLQVVNPGSEESPLYTISAP